MRVAFRAPILFGAAIARLKAIRLVKGHSYPAKKYIGPVFMFGYTSGNRIPDVLIAWNEPDRRSDGKIGPKISSGIAGESEDSMTAAVTGGKSLLLTAQRQHQWMMPCAYDHFEADAVTFATRCLVTGCSLCVLISAIPQRTFNSGM